MQTRQTPRIPVSVSAQYLGPRGRVWEIDVDDLSAGGCRVDDPQGGLQLGKIVSITIAQTGPYQAEVAWRQSARVGLEFTRPIPQRVIKALSDADFDEANEAFQQTASDAPVRRFV